MPQKATVKSKASPKARSKAKPKAPQKRATAARAKTKASEKTGTTGQPASRLIDERIRDLAGWRGAALARMRSLILEADPAMTEEWKWNVPVWSHDGVVCTGETYKQVVKLTFARGATVEDPARLFNSSLEGNMRRAIDIREGEQIDAAAFKSLIKAAVARNGEPAKKR
jgi:hypothetical protein